MALLAFLNPKQKDVHSFTPGWRIISKEGKQFLCENRMYT